MNARIDLILLRGQEALRTVPVVSRLVMGRSSANDLVLDDEDVSNHHAVLSRDGDQLRISDLKSTNGTWVNDHRVVGEQLLSDGDILGIGPRVRMQVRIYAATAPTEAPRLPMVRDLDAGISYHFDADRLHIGAAPECTIRLEGGPPRAGTLLVDPDGEIWLGTQGKDRLISLDEPFAVGACRLVLQAPPKNYATTLKSAEATRYPYRLHATLNGPGGAVATLQHLSEQRVHQIVSENRAILLYLLARQLAADRTERRERAAAGWCDDQNVLVGIWGRSAIDQASSALNVLVHRVRRELDDAGFDPWCIEKRRGATRIRVDAVEV